MKGKCAFAILASIMSVGLFSGCGGISQSEPSLSEVVNNFASVSKYDVANDGTESSVFVDTSGTLYILATRPNLKNVNAACCRINGQEMHGSTSSLNYPAGNGQNFFPFAEAQIDHGTSYELTCKQPSSARLIALFSPKSD